MHMMIGNVSAEYYVPDTAKCKHLCYCFTYGPRSGKTETCWPHQKHIELLTFRQI